MLTMKNLVLFIYVGFERLFSVGRQVLFFWACRKRMAAPVFGRSDSQVFLHVLGKERDVRELERDGYFLDAFVGIPQFVDDAFDGIFMNQCQCILPAHLLDDTGQVFGGIVELFGIIRQGTVAGRCRKSALP